MTTITFTVPNEKVSRIVDAMEGLFPIPEDTEGNPLFTKNQWAKEAMRRWIVKQVYRYERDKSIKDLNVKPDDTLAS